MNEYIAISLAMDVVNGKKTIGYVRSFVFNGYPFKYQEWIVRYYNPLHDVKEDVKTMRSIALGLNRIHSLSQVLRKLNKDIIKLQSLNENNPLQLYRAVKYSSDIQRIIKEKDYTAPANIKIEYEELKEAHFDVNLAEVDAFEAFAKYEISKEAEAAQIQKQKQAWSDYYDDVFAIDLEQKKLINQLQKMKQDQNDYTLLILGGIL